MWGLGDLNHQLSTLWAETVRSRRPVSTLSSFGVLLLRRTAGIQTYPTPSLDFNVVSHRRTIIDIAHWLHHLHVALHQLATP